MNKDLQAMQWFLVFFWTLFFSLAVMLEQKCRGNKVTSFPSKNQIAYFRLFFSFLSNLQFSWQKDKIKSDKKTPRKKIKNNTLIK